MPARRIPALLLVFAFASTPLFAADPPKYPFAKPPLELLDDLAKADLGKVLVPSEQERKLLATVWAKKAKSPAAAGELSDDELIDLMLFASGTTDAADRKKYREKITALRAEVGKALEGVKGTAARGEVLLKTVHESAMPNKYESGQSSLTAVFDTGKQNCVSSSALVYLVGKSHGFDLRPMSIPGRQFVVGHAFLDLVDGKSRVLVETTDADGYDAETKRNKPGVIVLGRVTNRADAHEVDGVGLAAMIYANRGAGQEKGGSPDRPAAVALTLCALALDPVSPTATNNLTASFVNWGPELAKAGEYERAVKACGFGLAAAPRSDDVWQNAHYTWAQYISATVAAKKDAEAVAVVARARKAMPTAKSFDTAAEWFERVGAEEATWEAGIAVIDRGLAVVPDGEKKRLLAARSGFYRQWSQKCLDKGDYDGSVKALAAGYARDPADKEIHAGIAYHMQVALPALGKKSVADAVEHFALLQKEFPKVAEVGEGGRAFARRVVHDLAEGGKYEDALKRIDELKAMLPTDAGRADCAGDVYDVWGRALADKKEFTAAIDKFRDGLKVCPKHERLGNNAVVTANDWAKQAIDAKDWDEAIRIYDENLKLFPNSSLLKDNKAYCEAMKASETKGQKAAKGK